MCLLLVCLCMCVCVSIRVHCLLWLLFSSLHIFFNLCICTRTHYDYIHGLISQPSETATLCLLLRDRKTWSSRPPCVHCVDPARSYLFNFSVVYLFCSLIIMMMIIGCHYLERKPKLLPRLNDFELIRLSFACTFSHWIVHGTVRSHAKSVTRNIFGST